MCVDARTTLFTLYQYVELLFAGRLLWSVVVAFGLIGKGNRKGCDSRVEGAPVAEDSSRLESTTF
jgi:hypothetical protein